MEAQQLLLETCLELVFSAYDAARRAGIAIPVVVLLDCEDEIGGQIARSWLGTEEVEDAIAQRRAEVAADAEGQDAATTVYAQAFAWQDCQDAIPKVFPYLGPVFSEQPADAGFLAISITGGGASALSVPPTAR